MSRKITNKSMHPNEGRTSYVRRDEDGRFTSKSLGNGYGSKKRVDIVRGTPLKGHLSQITNAGLTKHTAKSMAASVLSQVSTQGRDSEFPREIFSSEKEYNKSVDSVVARIKSGEVKARTPDE